MFYLKQVNVMFHGVPTPAGAFCRRENVNVQLVTLEISATRVKYNI